MKEATVKPENETVKRSVMILSVLLAIAFFGSLLWICLAPSVARSGGRLQAVISSEGAEDVIIDLSAVTEPYTLRIDAANGGYNLLLINHNEVRVLEASCPDKVCIRSSAIPSAHLPIVCLPNRLVIRYENAPENTTGIDAVTY